MTSPAEDRRPRAIVAIEDRAVAAFLASHRCVPDEDELMEALYRIHSWSVLTAQLEARDIIAALREAKP